MISEDAVPYEMNFCPVEGSVRTASERYWNEHTVNSTSFTSMEDSLKYLEWRFGEYPFFRELMDLWGTHDDEVILDYGCGPGNDLVGFLANTKARKVIGMDISEKSLSLAAQRLSLHRFDPARVEVIRITDIPSKIPLAAESIDYIYSEGVLHHTSDPDGILREFNRVLRQDGRASIMVYNRNSIWFHLYTAYMKIILEGVFPGLKIEDAFAKSTDGEHCPISRCYLPQEFIMKCEHAGFEAEFAGGYFGRMELEWLRQHGKRALEDERLEREHRDFLRSLKFDKKRFPYYEGKLAGIGGVYILNMRASRRKNKPVFQRG